MKFPLFISLALVFSSCGYLKYTIKPSALSNKIRTDGFYYESGNNNLTTIYFFYENGNVYRMWSQANIKEDSNAVYETITQRVINDNGIYRKGELTNWGTVITNPDSTITIQLRDSGGFMPLITMGSTVNDSAIIINWLIRKETNWDISKKKRIDVNHSLRFQPFHSRPKAVNLSPYIRN